MVGSTSRARHYRHRAQELRQRADKLTHEESKKSLLAIAAQYEHMAEREENRAKGSPPKNSN